MSRPRCELNACAGLVASAVSVGLVLVAPTHWLALVGVLMLASVPAGAAVMCWIDCGENFAQAGLTLVVSLAALALLSAIMIWVGAWHPSELLALAVAGACSCTLRLRLRHRAKA
jgi:hypothetical protein